MKKFVVAAVFAATAFVSSPSFAGGMSEPVMEPTVVEEKSAGSGGFVIPLMLIAILIAVAD